jgi:hypothetical protein
VRQRELRKREQTKSDMDCDCGRDRGSEIYRVSFNK